MKNEKPKADWKKITLNERSYFISKCGMAWSCHRNKLMKPWINRDGYKIIDSGKKQYVLHRLVATLFQPTENSDNLIVRHLDGNPLNNHNDNLAWGTHIENMEDMKAHGNSLKGSRNNLAILNEDQVIEIKKSNLSTKKLSEIYSVSYHTIWKIRKNINWSWLNVG